MLRKAVYASCQLPDTAAAIAPKEAPNGATGVNGLEDLLALKLECRSGGNVLKSLDWMDAVHRPRARAP
jgi:hypothetical protein